MIDSNFRGAVYVIQQGRVLYDKVTGYADLPNKIPNTPDTRFASASAGKVFVATAVLQFEYNPNNQMISVLVSNYGDNVWKEMRKIRETLY